MGNDAGGSGGTIDLTSDNETVDGAGISIRILQTYLVIAYI